MKECNIGFIGAGNMASALIGGLIEDGCSPDSIWVSDVDEDKAKALDHRLGVYGTTDNTQVLANTSVLILAVKPQVMKSVLQPLAPQIREQQPLVMSVAAGLRVSDLQRWLGDHVAIVRAMPNTPALVQSGATALFANQHVSATQRQAAESVMRAVGLTLWVQDEADMDAVTALSGSGPAYYFLVMEAMQKAGMELGLDANSARLLSLQTAFGAAKLALEASDDPAELRARVTSPGGTTEQAINSFQESGLEAMFAKAMQAARKRSEELAEQLGAD